MFFSLTRRFCPGIPRLFVFSDNKLQCPEISVKGQGSVVQGRIFFPEVSSCPEEVPETKEDCGPADDREVEDTGETLIISSTRISKMTPAA